MISLAEAIKLKSILKRKISDLSIEISTVAYTIVEKGEEPKTPNRTIQQVEADLAIVRKDSRTLDRLIYRANIDNFIEFNGEKLAIVEAIELATQLRAEAGQAKTFGLSEKESYMHSVGETTLYNVALFDPEVYRVRAIELEKQAHRLSNAINAKNYQVQIDFNDSAYF
ncbi:hypothetical protein P9B03_00570 [Metasolibacillus meyeri]|uniref:Uncharacterized protein n=1 Tax=Metasolibacillus meyeri TaxID=1071052 RepID=A0AAW9NQD6_9BACL|nr:hypothetical protein [Metasolibacillus meyeri]MEC1176981.1 hypothetical protein [Metasolibacillus meyeri]